jgi:hypothetical protein
MLFIRHLIFSSKRTFCAFGKIDWARLLQIHAALSQFNEFTDCADCILIAAGRIITAGYFHEGFEKWLSHHSRPPVPLKAARP